VVANQTLGRQNLRDAIRDRMMRGPAEFWVLAIPIPAMHLITDFAAFVGGSSLDPTVLSTATEIPDEGIVLARYNLQTELNRLRDIGAAADGVVGDANPMVAVENVLVEQQFDAIIVSTLPAGLSRWLAMDLPHRIRRKTNIPVTVITARY
jgi:hypothetical protein